MIYSSRMEMHHDALKWACILSLAVVTAMLLAESLGAGAGML
jgi:hypothetical protein